LELACLHALWRIGEGSVKDVRGVIAGDRNLAYTTVMTVLERLAKRGAVERKKSGRAFVYLPLMQREQARRLAVRELADTYFDGSLEHLRTYLGGPEITTPPAPPAVQTSAEDDLDESLL
jgi:BlaI family transcriptional regulator, penicillinase repressor